MYDPTWMKGGCLSIDEYKQMIAENEEVVKAIHEKMIR